MWILKEDGTHDKFSAKKGEKNKENNEKDAADDDIEEEDEEEVLTFICNEKIQ